MKIPLYECGVGWHYKIDHLVNTLCNLPYDVYILQIKEKFGRFDINWSLEDWDNQEEVENIIREFKERIDLTCENCGSEDRVCIHRFSFWLKALCKKCRTLKNIEEEAIETFIRSEAINSENRNLH